MLKKLRALLDPRGPLGEVLSPSEVYKSRGAMTTGKAYVAVAKQGVTDDIRAAVEATLPPERYVVAGEESPPADRVRVLSRFVEERWEPVCAPIDGDSYAAVLAASQGSPRVAGWRVTYHARSAFCDCHSPKYEYAKGGLIHVQCGRPAQAKVGAEDFVEHVQSLQIQNRDDFYNGMYATLGGKNAEDRKSHIIGGRTEYRKRTAGMLNWGSTRDEIEATSKALRKKHAEREQEKSARIDRAVEKWSKSMPRSLGEL